MPKKSQEYLNYVLEDVLGHIPLITARGMFGGHGIYKDGIIFGLIVDDQLYFKVDDSNRADYADRDSQPFEYIGAGQKRISVGYWLVPEEVMEDRVEIVHWVNKSVAISRAKAGVKGSKRRIQR